MRRGPAWLTALALALALAGPVVALAGPPFWPGVGGGGSPFWPGGSGNTQTFQPFFPPGNSGATPPPNTEQPGFALPSFINSLPFQSGRVPTTTPPEACRLRGMDARADIVFTAVLSDQGRRVQGRQFEFGAVQDLLIEVRWTSLDVSSRQRLELYGPGGHLYRTATRALPAFPDPVTQRIPVLGSSIETGTLAGSWCARVFLDDELEPSGADAFELRLPRR